MSERSDEERALSVLLAQYHECSAHHMHFMGLIWQVPAVAVAIAAGLTSVAFALDTPPVARTFVLFMGAALMTVMTVALERYRMFQLRRRRDLMEIESSLAALGGHKLVWHGDEIAREVGQGEFGLRGLPFYRFEGFQWLRALMYVIVLALSSLFLLTLVGIFGAGPFAA